MSKSSEYKTRREKIDVLLKKTGWDVTDRTKVVQEVDTKPFNPTIVQFKLPNCIFNYCRIVDFQFFFSRKLTRDSFDFNDRLWSFRYKIESLQTGEQFVVDEHGKSQKLDS